MIRTRLSAMLFAGLALFSSPVITATGHFELFVTSGGSVLQVDRFGNSSVFVTTAVADGSRSPLALAFDRDGNLYVSLSGTGEIHKFGREGEDLGLFATIGGTNPFADLIFDAAGNLYGSRFSNNEIWRFTADGTGAELFAVTGDGPSGLTFDQSSHLFVALINAGGGAIAEYSPDGALLDTFSPPGMTFPIDVVFRKRALWVTSIATHDIRRYTTAGDLVGVFAAGLEHPHVMAFDADGSLYVTDNARGTIRHFSRTGADLGDFVAGLSYPDGLAFRSEKPRRFGA